MTYLRGNNVLVKTQKDLLCDTDYRYEDNKSIKNTKPWKTFNDLYGKSLNGLYKISNEPRTRIIQVINNQIIDKFCDLVLTDMIDNAMEFEFPYRRFTISIADRDKNSMKYSYNIKNRGHDYIPYLRFNRSMYNKTWVYYFLHLRPKWKERLQKAIDRGQEYKQALQKRRWR